VKISPITERIVESAKEEVRLVRELRKEESQ